MKDSIFIKDIIHNFVLEENLSASDQAFLRELIPISEKVLSFGDYISLLNEIASFYTGELARLIKKYLLLNDLLAKDNARLIREELLLFSRFFHFLINEMNITKIKQKTEQRMDYVLLKVDKYLKKYSPYLII